MLARLYRAYLDGILKWTDFLVYSEVIDRFLVSDFSTLIEKDLTIYDNGIGIPSDEISRVFNKGFTGNKGRVNYKSTGIGLYLCKKLCDKLGLLIKIESEENEYTKINIIFPKGNFSKV